MFKFKLASVLSLKEKMEDSKKRELGAAIIKAEEVRFEKETLASYKQEAIKEVKEQNMGTIDVQYLQAFNQYSLRIDKEIEKKADELIKADQMVHSKRQELLEAVKERKILENLKEIQQEAHNEEEKREEQRILDDIVTYKYGMKGEES